MAIHFAGIPGSKLIDGRTGEIIGTFDEHGLLTDTAIKENAANSLMTRIACSLKPGYKITVKALAGEDAQEGVRLNIAGGPLPYPFTVKTDAYGTAEIWLAPGTYRVLASKEGFAGAEAGIAVTTASKTVDIEIAEG